MPAEEEDLIAVCTECRSDIAERYLEKSALGASRACPFCGGGMIIIVERERRQQALDQHDRSRGIGSG